MKKYKTHLPVVISSVLLALVSTGLIGHTNIVSSIFGTAHISFIADIFFLILTLIFSFLIWQLYNVFPKKLGMITLWLISFLCLFLLFVSTEIFSFF